ncbi:MAG: hypothetical protein AABY22_12105 [Nanoarchaeota archaeon]
MQKKLLDKILMETFGKTAVKIGDLLYGKKNINEFIIAKKLDLTINQTRNLLYKLAESGLVFSMRKKDRKKGWYTYFWTLDIGKSLDFLRNTLEKKIKEIQNNISTRETRRFYYCNNCKIEYNEENALIRDFICSECGRVLELKDNREFVADKKKELEILEKELKFVAEELGKEKVLIGKKRQRQENREKKKKEKIRAEKREIMKKEREKMKTIKSSVKKRTKKTQKKKIKKVSRYKKKRI